MADNTCRIGSLEDKPRREWPCATCKSKAHSTKQHDLADSYEDKPTIDCDCVAHQMGCDVPVPDSKPENYDRNLQSYLDAGGKIRDLPPDSLGLSKPEKPLDDVDMLAVEVMTMIISPKQFREKIQALLATEYDRGKVEAVKAYLEENYGPRCKENLKGCITCDQWANYDEWLKAKGESK